MADPFWPGYAQKCLLSITTIFTDFSSKRFSVKSTRTEAEECDLWYERNKIDFDEWMKMDLEYIDNWSSGLDFKILWKTMKVVLTAEGR